jgi:hypothetical protein
MVTRIIIFALIAGVVYLNYTVPKIEDHKAFLLEELQIGYALNEEQQEKLWKKVDYSNFFVCSFMKHTESSVMISYGFLKQVKLANDKWVAETRTETLKRSNY